MIFRPRQRIEFDDDGVRHQNRLLPWHAVTDIEVGKELTIRSSAGDGLVNPRTEVSSVLTLATLAGQRIPGNRDPMTIAGTFLSGSSSAALGSN